MDAVVRKLLGDNSAYAASSTPLDEDEDTSGDECSPGGAPVVVARPQHKRSAPVNAPGVGTGMALVDASNITEGKRRRT